MLTGSVYPGEGDISTIQQSRIASNAAILKRDVDAVASFWTADFVQIAGDGSYSKGKAAISAEWKLMFKHSNPVFERITDEIIVSASGDMAWEKGTWNYKTERFFGNYSAMWRKVKGQWLTQCEMYVSLNK